MSSDARPAKLSVTVVEARHLGATDLDGNADPYVKLTWRNKKYRTEIKRKTLKPEWGQTFSLDYGSGLADGSCLLVLQVKDWDMLKKNDPLGSVSLQLPGLSSGFYADRWYRLDAQRGELRLQLALLDDDYDVAEGGTFDTNMFLSMAPNKEMQKTMQSTMMLPPVENDTEDDAICLTEETPEKGDHRTSRGMVPRGRVYVVRPSAPRYQLYGNLTPVGKLTGAAADKMKRFNQWTSHTATGNFLMPSYVSSAPTASNQPTPMLTPPIAIKINDVSGSRYSISAPPTEAPASEHHPAGTAQKVSEMLEVLPQCRPAEVLAALKKVNYDKEKATQLLLDEMVDNASKTPEAKQLFQSAIDMFGSLGGTMRYDDFVHKTQVDLSQLTKTQRIKYQVQQAQHVSMSPDEFIKATGTRKALIIGINYVGSKEALRGCVDDAKRMKKLLTHVYGFPDTDEHIVLMTDDSPNPLLRPTYNNMIKAMMWLTSEVKSGDVLFFHYSGHGSQKKSDNPYEPDGMDETILPLDWRKSGHIIDDTLHQLLVEPLPEGCKLTAILDCCHSGTGMDLPFSWDIGGKRWDTEFHPFLSLADVQLFSGCRSDQTSADVSTASSAGGAMTFALLAALSSCPYGHTYPSLMDRLHRALAAKGFKQKPQLSSSQKFTVNRPFSLTDIVPNTNEYIGREGPRRKKLLPPPNVRSREIPGCDF